LNVCNDFHIISYRNQKTFIMTIINVFDDRFITSYLFKK